MAAHTRNNVQEIDYYFKLHKHILSKHIRRTVKKDLGAVFRLCRYKPVQCDKSGKIATSRELHNAQRLMHYGMLRRVVLKECTNFPEKRVTSIFRVPKYSWSKDNPEDEGSMVLQRGH